MAVNLVGVVVRKAIAMVVLVVTTALATILSQKLLKYVDDSAVGAPGGERVHQKHLLAAESCIETASGAESLDGVGGLDEVRSELHRSVVLPLRHREIFFGPVDDGAAPPACLLPARTHLFYGPPGTGKTLVARALASQTGATFVNIALSVLEDKWYGETPKILRALFHVARDRAPSILFFDEIDGCARHRSQEDASHTYALKTELLLHMDALARGHAPVYVIACTNHAHLIDKAMLRRFEQRHLFGLPDAKGRAAILGALLKEESASQASTAALVQRVAEATPGRSGSDLAAMHRAACSRRLNRCLQRVSLEQVRSAEQLTSMLGALTADDWPASDPPADADDDDDKSDDEEMPPAASVDQIPFSRAT